MHGQQAGRVAVLAALAGGILSLLEGTTIRADVPPGRVEVVAGGSDFGDGGPALQALFVGIGGLAVDPKGTVYVADSGGNRVRKIDPATGIITAVAGTGLMTGDFAARKATERPLRGPAALALDPAGRYLFVGEVVGRRVQRIDLAAGTIEDLGEPKGTFGKPAGLAWTPAGLLVADSVRGQVWQLGHDGSGGWKSGLPEGTHLRGGIRSLARDSAGGVYIAEYFSHRIARMDPRTGKIETAVGTGESGRSADGARASQSAIRTPDGIAFDGKGNLLVADMGNRRICRVDAATGRMQTVLKSGERGTEQRWTPGPLAVDAAGNLWVGDIHRNRVLRFAPGAETPVVVAGEGDLRDGPALEARLAHPGSVAADAQGNIYISDTLHQRVRRVDATTGRIRTVAGNGFMGYNGDGMPATEAHLGYPAELQLDSAGRLYIGDYYNNRVRVVEPESGRIFTLAGNGEVGEGGDGGPAKSAPLLNPHALLLEADGSLTIASAVSSRLRRIDLASGRIQSVPVGEGVAESLVFHGMARWNGGLVLALPRPGAILFLKDGQMGQLISKPDISFPQDVAVSPGGELYICETGRNRIVKWNGQGLEVVLEDLGRPRAIAFDARGDLLIADTFHNRVLRLRLTRAPGEMIAAGRSLSPPPASSR